LEALEECEDEAVEPV
jgi:hypothetical protein